MKGIESRRLAANGNYVTNALPSQDGIDGTECGSSWFAAVEVEARHGRRTRCDAMRLKVVCCCVRFAGGKLPALQKEVRFAKSPAKHVVALAA